VSFLCRDGLITIFRLLLLQNAQVARFCIRPGLQAVEVRPGGPIARIELNLIVPRREVPVYKLLHTLAEGVIDRQPRVGGSRNPEPDRRRGIEGIREVLQELRG
jgi:hypothetical protein